MLEISHVFKTFNPGPINEKAALTDLQLHLEPGDFATVIGGNGAGKSTMLNVVSGTYSVDGGSISIGGEDVTKLPEYKRAGFLGRVFQDPMTGTAATMNIEENMALANRRGKRRSPFRWGLTAQERRIFRDKLADLDLGLENRMTSKVGLLSGGQRQALTLLMATLMRPKLLLLDEHTAALDPKTAEKVLILTRQLIRENGLTTLMVTHNMRDALAMGNRLIMMDEGHIVLDIRGEDKAKMTVSQLLERFGKVSGKALDNDRMLLS
ncbi:MAG: ATP-binding cassette domain-containing protein [Clostridia bacterium]|nr:ATP-binding cassette domain-containing protein [Clostridia bacterium]